MIELFFKPKMSIYESTFGSCSVYAVVRHEYGLAILFFIAAVVGGAIVRHWKGYET